MTAQHKHVEDLVSEVTFGKVEHILQVNTLPGDWLCHLEIFMYITLSYAIRQIEEFGEKNRSKIGRAHV